MLVIRKIATNLLVTHSFFRIHGAEVHVRSIGFLQRTLLVVESDHRAQRVERKVEEKAKYGAKYTNIFKLAYEV